MTPENRLSVLSPIQNNGWARWGGVSAGIAGASSRQFQQSKQLRVVSHCFLYIPCFHPASLTVTVNHQNEPCIA